MKERTILLPAGLGDSIWIFQKLVNSGEKFNLAFPDAQPQRAHQLLELLPQLIVSCKYVNYKYRDVKNGNVQGRKKFWKLVSDSKFYLSMNEWLERGKRIEDFFPDLPTSYRLEYKTQHKHIKRADELLPFWFDKIIGLYCSSYAGSKNWGTWMHEEWATLAEMLYKHTGATMVVIGADWDIDLTTKLTECLKQKNIPYVTVISEELGTVIEVMKRLKAFIGFPSGLSILNETLGAEKTLMFYSEPIKGIINTWADPERIKSGAIKECLFCEPGIIFNWIKENWKL